MLVRVVCIIALAQQVRIPSQIVQKVGDALLYVLIGILVIFLRVMVYVHQCVLELTILEMIELKTVFTSALQPTHLQAC